jgi:hypothetical protein
LQGTVVCGQKFNHAVLKVELVPGISVQYCRYCSCTTKVVKSGNDLIETTAGTATPRQQFFVAAPVLLHIILKASLGGKTKLGYFLTDKPHDHRIAGGIRCLADAERHSQGPVVAHKSFCEPTECDGTRRQPLFPAVGERSQQSEFV